MNGSNNLASDALAMVNTIRLAYGHTPLNDLPTSRVGQASDCLFARALRDVGVSKVGGDGTMSFGSERVAQHVASILGTTAEGTVVTPPAQFAGVIGAFDNGQLPAHSIQP